MDKPSKLAKYNIGYEFDRTLRSIKVEIRKRTIKP